MDQTALRADEILDEQRHRYEGGFYRRNRWRWTFRDDCRYRWHRLRQLLGEVGFAAARKCVLDIGFGSGDLLFLFPTSCRLMGIELSRAAVEAVQADPRLTRYEKSWFETVRDDGSLPALPWPADLILCSHVLEHVPDDRQVLGQARGLLGPDGMLVVFVPLEPAGFDPKHVRCYTPESVAALFRDLDLELVHLEANYRICFGPLRWMDHPARYDWPVLQWIEGVRNVLMTLIPHGTTVALEEVLAGIGAPPTQIMAVGQPRR